MKILDTGPAQASSNMEVDEALLKGLMTRPEALLHFYEWLNPSATFGYFIDPYTYLRKEAAIDLAKRPTGGGVIFHLTDLAFSVLIPANHPRFSLNTLENYRYINERVACALKLFNNAIEPSLLLQNPQATSPACCGFCMAKPTIYDVMIDGKKVAGGAQRRTRHGFLHQGSICLTLPDPALLKSLLSTEGAIWEAMQAHSYPLVDQYTSYEDAKAILKKHLVEAFKLEQGYP